MNGVVKGLCKGAAVSAVTVVIALTGVGFYLALMLLVIAMEEGGENLTVHALPFAQTTLLARSGHRLRLGRVPPDESRRFC